MNIERLTRNFELEPLLPAERPTKEDIEYLLVELNQTRDQLALYFNRSLSQVKRWLHDYNIKKPKSLRAAAIRKGVQQKYGVDNVSQLQEVKNKKEQKAKDKYGTINVFASEEIKEKIAQSNMQKYGVKNPAQNTKIYAKIQQTNLERYGFKNPNQNPEVREKIKATCMKKYGRENVLLRNYSKETLEIVQSKERFEEFLKTRKGKWTTKIIAQTLNICHSNAQKLVHKYGMEKYIDYYTSSYELELQSLFPHMHKTKSIITPYEIDLYDEEHKFGIEFNGNYWHSELKLPQNYHQKKSLVAEDAGIFLYHIWEYEWQDPILREKILSQIKNILGKNEKRLYARKCYVKSIRKETAEVFIDAYHIQGYTSDSVRLGLYHDAELVAVMTFGKPRFKSRCEWELIRYCSKADTSVVGGASKLFKEFIRMYNPQSILSYSHIDKGTGKLYEKLGFKLEKISNPDYVWCDGEDVLSRYQCQKHKLNKLGFEGSEREIMDNLGFFRIFGCGNKVWFWTNEN